LNSDNKRQSRICTEQDAAALVKDGMTIYVGGFVQSSHPMAIIRQIIRNKVRNLTVVGAATSSMEVDILIAAGVARKIIAPYVGIEGHIAVAPFFRAYAESGDIEVWEIDESMHYTALRAASLDLPFLPDRSGVGTDYMGKLNPDFKFFNDPIKGEPMIAVPAVAPDIAFLHAASGDEFGNIRFIGSGFGDRTASRASSITVVQVEKIISNEETRMTPQQTSIHGVDHVVRAPFGAHPFSSPGFYTHDDEMLREYVDAGKAFLKTRDRALIDAFLQKWVYAPETNIDYLEVVGLRRLMTLNEY
jgi:glutaconate CoA-transferase subunit A